LVPSSDEGALFGVEIGPRRNRASPTNEYLVASFEPKISTRDPGDAGENPPLEPALIKVEIAVAAVGTAVKKISSKPRFVAQAFATTIVRALAAEALRSRSRASL
jgi:hypothetical protein